MNLGELRAGEVYWFYDPYAGPRKVTCLGPPSRLEIHDYFGNFSFDAMYQKIRYAGQTLVEIFMASIGYNHHFEPFPVVAERLSFRRRQVGFQGVIVPNSEPIVRRAQVNWIKTGF